MDAMQRRLGGAAKVHCRGQEKLRCRSFRQRIWRFKHSSPPILHRKYFRFAADASRYGRVCCVRRRHRVGFRVFFQTCAPSQNISMSQGPSCHASILRFDVEQQHVLRFMYTLWHIILSLSHHASLITRGFALEEKRGELPRLPVPRLFCRIGWMVGGEAARAALGADGFWTSFHPEELRLLPAIAPSFSWKKLPGR